MRDRNKNDRPLVELCHRLRIRSEHVAGSTGDQFRRRVQLDVVGILKPVVLPMESTAQRLGRRWWWICPACARHRAVLLREPNGQSFACRRCLRAQYFGDCPSRRPHVALAQAVGWSGPIDHWRQIAFLIDRRMRGVRRGRRLKQRVARLLACAPTLTEFVNPDMVRFTKWFVEEDRLQAANEISRQRRAARSTRRAALRHDGSGGTATSFPGQPSGPTL